MSLLNPKQTGKAILCHLLEKQVNKLRSRHNFTLITVSGSVGKTSTKLAIANVLAASKTVIRQEGNFNDRLTVPLTIFGQDLPGLFNLGAWLKVLKNNRRMIAQGFHYKYAVVELGTDHPGEMTKFAYLKPDLAVVTAVTEEHMESFKTIEAVAEEELAVFKYAKQVLVNIDDTPLGFLEGYKYQSLSLNNKASFEVRNIKREGPETTSFKINTPTQKNIDVEAAVLGTQGVKVCALAIATAQMAGLKTEEIIKGVQKVQPFAGRMQILQGAKDSILIDDTYNASPASVLAGLDVLYDTPSEQRIAILGSMNELGDFSAEAHRQVGEYCDPKKLDLVVTIGQDAAKYLAPVAKQAGCRVKSFSDPYSVGRYVLEEINSKSTVILVKGSQNGVFSEEALKLLLANPSDKEKLVRQSKYWLSQKKRQFKV